MIPSQKAAVKYDNQIMLQVWNYKTPSLSFYCVKTNHIELVLLGIVRRMAVLRNGTTELTNKSPKIDRNSQNTGEWIDKVMRIIGDLENNNGGKCDIFQMIAAK